jgi:UDP-N-acetylmuramyl tripeptide synthase
MKQKKPCFCYVQKPVDGDELITEITRLLNSDALYEMIMKEYFNVFKEALLDGMNKMNKNVINYRDEYSDNRDHESNGIAVIIGIIGKFSGRMMFDVSKRQQIN